MEMVETVNRILLQCKRTAAANITPIERGGETIVNGYIYDRISISLLQLRREACMRLRTFLIINGEGECGGRRYGL